MTPEERQMISDLFERVRSTGLQDKDREADALIAQLVRSTPDAAYKLVQSVLVQEGALDEQGQRIQDLEDQVRQLEDQIQQTQQPAPRSGGSFLGGARAAPAPTGVPVTNRSGGFGQASAAPQSSPWGQPQGGYQQPMQQQPQPMQQQAPARGGGFMRSALGMAAGVAGGMFAANAIKDMMGGGSAKAESQTGSQESSPYEVNQTSNTDQQGYGYQSEESNDPGSSWGGGGGDDSTET